MPFGFSKKDKEKDKDEDSQRSALFGKSSKSSKSPAPPTNPYAVSAPTNDPYSSRPAADPYAPKPSSFSQPPPYQDNDIHSNRPRQEKTPVPVGGYGNGPSSSNRYGGSSNYGQASGYGANPYGSEPAAPPQRPGGYGGLGRANSQDTVSTDAGRAALFGDAPSRTQRPGPSSDGPPDANNPDASYSNYGESSFQGGGGGGGGGGYNGYPDRELTAEEQEEEDVQAAKDQIRFIKQQDVASTRNARRIAEQAEQTGRETLARLGQQGERIHNAERNLDMASTQNRIAQERAAEIKTLNRSMFAVHVSNPFTKTKREMEANQAALDRHREERAREDATRDEAQHTASRQAGFGRQLGERAPVQKDKKSLAQRSKYQFEADSDDDAMEDEIDDNLEAIHRGAKVLNQLGHAMGTELDSQNKHINRIIGKTDLVDDEIAVNRARLDRIR